ncbi:putative HNH endonuclease [metagenome]|uniref:Putative HNH endonuclease n=1 Tax=metagenome TaxID=256318 RepID=A0A2P2C3A5_9ZZZZ
MYNPGKLCPQIAFDRLVIEHVFEENWAMSIAATVTPVEQDLPAPDEVLARVRGSRQVADQAEVDVLLGAAQWADLHPTLPGGEGALGDALLPDLEWDAPAEFAATLGMSSSAGTRLIHHALELRHRLPRLWSRLLDGQVQVWRARRIAERTVGQPAEVAAHVDQTLAGIAHRVGAITLDRVIDEALLRLDPEEHEIAQLEALDSRYATLHETSINHTGIAEMTLRAEWKDLKDFDDALAEVAAALVPRLDAEGITESLDVRRAMAIGVLADPQAALDLLQGAVGSPAPGAKRPRRQTTLVVHLTDSAILGGNAVGRVQASQGGTRPVLESQIRDWCARTDTQLRVQPVIDLNDHVHVQQYEVPDRLRTRSDLFHQTCMFPWCTRPARSCDSDHVIAHAAGGATCDCNLAPLCRRHHRLKTKTGWRYRRIESGVFLWTSPHGYQFLRDHAGTHDTSTRTSQSRGQSQISGPEPPVPRRTGCDVLPSAGANDAAR